MLTDTIRIAGAVIVLQMLLVLCLVSVATTTLCVKRNLPLAVGTAVVAILTGYLAMQLSPIIHSLVLLAVF